MSEATKQICRKVKNQLYEERPEVIEKIRNTVKTAYENDPDYRKRIGRGVQEVFERDPTILTRISDSVKRLWQNPDYRARAVEGMEAIHVNNPELSCRQYEKSKNFYCEHLERKAVISAQVSAYLRSSQGRKFVESDSHPKSVLGVETREIFPSQHAAELTTGYSGIHKVCAGVHRTSGGYHWEYVQGTEKENRVAAGRKL